MNLHEQLAEEHREAEAVAPLRRVTPTPCGFVAIEALGAAGYYYAPRAEWPAAIDRAINSLGRAAT